MCLVACSSRSPDTILTATRSFRAQHKAHARMHRLSSLEMIDTSGNLHPMQSGMTFCLLIPSADIEPHPTPFWGRGLVL